MLVLAIPHHTAHPRPENIHRMQFGWLMADDGWERPTNSAQQPSILLLLSIQPSYVLDKHAPSESFTSNGLVQPHARSLCECGKRKTMVSSEFCYRFACVWRTHHIILFNIIRRPETPKCPQKTKKIKQNRVWTLFIHSFIAMNYIFNVSDGT